jgi:starch-binding outer membrane protein, SusD/RagB family
MQTLNKTVKKVYAITALLALMLCHTACKKFLDEKPNAKLAVPTTVQDVQALMDQYAVMNGFFPNMGAESDDDFYMKDAYYNTSKADIQRTYTWHKDAYNEMAWRDMYSIVLAANLGLETLEKINISGGIPAGFNRAKGSALFLRSMAFYQLAQYYAKPYNPSIAALTPGIPVRLQSDITTPNIRNNSETTYRQITEDLLAALPLLPNLGDPVSRPSRAACFALLADVYLTMGQYDKTRAFADSSLKIKGNLLDYNSLNTVTDAPFTQFNAEVVFTSITSGATRLYINNGIIDTILFTMYDPNDLRKTLFFKNLGTGLGYGFKGNYDGSPYGQLFNGIAVDEVYLLRAEAAARLGNKDAAMADINILLQKRYKTGFFVPLSASTAADALKKVLTERRKELVGRSRRWFDLRRLNQDPAFAVTLYRKVTGTVYQLPPNDNRYTFYIPLNVVSLTGMEQNIR